MVDRLLKGRLSIAGISRVTGISEMWLQRYVNRKYEEVPKKVKVSEKKGRLVLQLDEAWSFVGNKGNKKWLWFALDASTREIVGVAIGSREREAAQEL